ncbi:unnamed protein product [Cylindrotheca closterium]|uniref:Orc1-like AAA ATPase domain-containing protein n=1 Tax=Cylindrotheca closterium TaxID=2856 RepID=A0AAD2G3G3_9STRA|nr:unnamed protein product [Cylindrotheca closterium]
MDHSTSDDATSLSKTSLSEDVGCDDSFADSRRSLTTSDLMELKRSTKNNARVQGPRQSKLRYGSIEFVGREVESEILHSRLRRVVTNSNGQDPQQGFKEFVVIKGDGGVGKSALSQRLQGWTNELDNAIFVKGKFGLATNTPYSGIAQAFGKVCQEAHLKKLKDGSSSVGNLLISELGSEVHLLVTLIPELQIILPEEERGRVPLHDENGFEAGMEQWKHIFRVLVRVLGSFLSPMVIVLDDLQWADVASLSVIDFLLTDTQNINGIMIVGCFRSDEVDDSHVLSKAISILAEKTEKGIFKLTTIDLGNISIGDTNKIIMAMLDMGDEAKTEPLAKVCFKRTLGNPFFLIEFLTMLEAEGLITFSLGKWDWTVQTVDESTKSTNSVVDLIQDRMKKLPEDMQLLLQYAANLGSSFTHTLMELIWSSHSSNTAANKESCDLQSMYGELESGKYIEGSQNDRFHWVHDKVQEAVLTLGEASSPAFQFEIGFILYGRLGSNELEESLFDVVNLINKGQIGNPQRRIEFCKLNLRAVQKARNLSAFDSASGFVASGIKLLPPDKWSSTHRELTLPLLTIGAEMALASGSVNRMDLYADEVLFREDCTTVEKLPLYLTMTYKQATIDLKYDRALELSLAVLKDLGCPIVRNEALVAVQALRALMRIVRTARREKIDYARSLPLMTDEVQKSTMTFLNRSLYAAYMMQKISLAMALVTRMYDITLEHGISPETGPAFGTLSMVVVTALKDYDTAAFFAEAGIKTQQRTGSKYNEASTLYTAAFAAKSWRQPLQDCSDLMLEAYCVGMRSGNTVYAMSGLCKHQIEFPFLLGKPLGPILTAGSQSIHLMEEVKQEEQVISSQLFCQTIANLMGKSNQTTLLQGEWFNTVGWTPPSQLEGDLNFHRLALLVYFGDFEAAAELALSNGDSFEKKASGCFMVPPEAFLHGVALYAMTRQSRKFRYRRAAHQILVKFENWTKAGNPNVQSYQLLLKAEQAAFRKNHKDAESLYEEAVAVSALAGQSQTAGLVSERYADFLMTEKKDLVLCRHQKEQAIGFYTDWGADALVKRIEDSMTAGKQIRI